MNRFSFMVGQKRPATLNPLGKVWCSWNAFQARECGTRENAIYTMRQRAIAYGMDSMGANVFDEWELEEEVDWSQQTHGYMRLTGQAYYRS